MDMAALLRETVLGKVISRHALNIALTVAVADWMQCLPFEIEVIWAAKWNLVKILYMLNRYFLIDIFLYYVYLDIADVETCNASFIGFGITALIGVAFAEMVIFIRLYALSGQSLVYRIWLPLQFLAVQVAAYTLSGIFFKTVTYAPSPLPEYITCWPISGTVTLVTAFLGVLMANETVILLAMVYIGVKKHRRMRTPLITTFYRDGFVFFLALAGSSIVNIVLHLSLPPSINSLFATPQRAIHSILASRMIVHLREQSYQQENGHSFDDRFHPTILGRTSQSSRSRKSDVMAALRGGAKFEFMSVHDMQ